MESIEKFLGQAFAAFLFCLAFSILMIGIGKFAMMQDEVRERIGNEKIIVRINN